MNLRYALVIGGASGIGRGMAEVLSNSGYLVLIADRIVDEVNPWHFKVDAVDPASVSALAERLRTVTDSLEVIMVTAGGIDEGSVFGQAPERWKWMLEINLMTAVHAIDIFLPFLQKADAPKVLLTGSFAGLGSPSLPGLSLYTVAKHALIGYYRAARIELSALGIQLSLLLPSAVIGNLAANSATMRQEKLGEIPDVNKGSQPAGRMLADAKSVAPLFVKEFLAGKSIISNAPEILINKLAEELDLLRSEFKEI